MVCLAAGIFLGSAATAQLTVIANGNVGIGTTNPIGKMDVLVNTADLTAFSARFLNTSTSNTTKYGIYNQVNTSGTGGRFGTYSVTQGASTTTAGVYGYLNSTNGGTGVTYGHYNVTTGNSSTGNTYGVYNLVNQRGSVSGGTGIYNRMYSASTGTTQSYGLLNTLDTRTSGTSYGIYNQVLPFSTICPPGGIRYGIYNTVSTTGPGLRYGIYSQTPGAANFAGYFVGNVYIQGNLTVTSDDKLKTGVNSLNNALDIIKQLDAKTYIFRKDIKGMQLAEGNQVGLLASDVEKVLPQLVTEVNTPINVDIDPIDIDPIDIEPYCLELEELKTGLDDKGNPAEPPSPKLFKTSEGSFYKLKSVNYTALIPVLVQAVKEQQKTIDELKQLVEKQQALLGKLLPAAGK